MIPWHCPPVRPITITYKRSFLKRFVELTSNLEMVDFWQSTKKKIITRCSDWTFILPVDTM